MELIKNEHPYYDFKALDALRKKLAQNTQTLTITDLGAGSKKIKTNQRPIKQIAKHGIAPKKQAEFLYRLVNYFNPTTIIELGTSIGLTTLYLAKAKPSVTVYTLEGDAQLAAFSEKLFKEEKCSNIKSIKGNFNETFPKLLDSLPSVDFLYLDGNHAYEPTMRYFALALQKKTAQSVIIIDDINWSEDMQCAWQDIKQQESVTLSFDFFYFGMVFFRKEQKEKEHFVLRF